MSIWSDLRSSLFKSQEAAGVSLPGWGDELDPTPSDWRRLSAKAPDELPPYQVEKMLALVRYLWRTNPLAKNMIELIISFVIGGGVRVESTHPQINEVLREFWEDPVKSWDGHLARRIRDLCLYGEVIWPVFVNPISGFVRMTSVPPWEVEDVITHPGDWERPEYVIVKSWDGISGRRALKIVSLDEQPDSPTLGRLVGFSAPTEATSTPVTMKYQTSSGSVETVEVIGSCFYFAVNVIDVRGFSDLAPAIDWLDAHDQYLFTRLERANLLLSFIWDVEMQGLNQEQLQKQATDAQKNPPKPGSFRFHNEKTKWSAIAPNLQSDAGAEESRTFKNYILASVGHPEHWYSAGDQANRATAVEMGEPVMKLLETRQEFIRELIQFTLRFVADQAIIAGVIQIDADGRVKKFGEQGEPIHPYETISVIMPDMSVRNMGRSAVALSQAANGLMLARDRGWISDETSRRTMVSVLAQLGIETDSEEELSRINVERKSGANGRVSTEPIQTQPAG